jgi:hypothetical protein
MVKGAEVRRREKRGHTSHESESNISVASTNRDGSGDETDFEEYESGLGAAKTHPSEIA